MSHMLVEPPMEELETGGEGIHERDTENTEGDTLGALPPALVLPPKRGALGRDRNASQTEPEPPLTVRTLNTAREVRRMPPKERRARERSLAQVEAIPVEERVQLYARVHAAKKRVGTKIIDFVNRAPTSSDAQVDAAASRFLDEIVQEERAMDGAKSKASNEQQEDQQGPTAASSRRSGDGRRSARARKR